MGRGANNSYSCSSSSMESNTDLSTDLRLGLSIDNSRDWPQFLNKTTTLDEGEEENGNATFYVKVYMEGIPIGRKLDLLAHDSYYQLINTLDHMFNTNILWTDDVDGAQFNPKCHVLTYEDKEGDWMMVGDVPWEMFLSTVRRLKITRI